LTAIGRQRQHSQATHEGRIPRRSVVLPGYGIVANIGNHPTDLAGGNSGKQYLLPNYGFLS